MILYLDNQGSIGRGRRPRSGPRSASTGNPKLDINENLAREILELHTLGVNAGYTQQDVTTFALALTGWSVANGMGKQPERAGQFEFREQAHEPGAKSILGKSYKRRRRRAAARSTANDLATHPATANARGDQVGAAFHC